MRNRICLLLLAVVLVLTCIPAIETQAAKQPDYDNKSDIRAIVSKAVLAHANKVQQTDSHLDALTDMAYHAMLKNGATLYLNDKSSTAASMFNALMFQEALTEGITNAIIQAQDLNQTEFFTNGIVSWHVYGDVYSFNGWLGNKRNPNGYLGPHTNSKTIYGGFYPGAQNANDTAMQLIAGGLNTDFVLKRSAAKSNTMVYEVKLHIHDIFDFNSTYSYQEGKGYDVSTDRLLIKLGKMLNLMGADNFSWEYNVTLKIEVPYTCDHTFSSYRWIYDDSTHEINSIAGSGFQNNPTIKEEYTTESGEVRRNYKLSKPVLLLHNKPWVVEYDSTDGHSLVLCATAAPVSLPYLCQSGRSHTWISEYIYDKIEIDREGYMTSSSTHHYTGIYTSGQFKYVNGHNYTYRLENRVAANGSNMIWLSIYDKTTGQQVMAPSPMDEHSIQDNGESDRTIVSENSTRLSGKDLVINYIGSRWNVFRKSSLELRIWENGLDTSTASAMTTSYKAPTCTEAGGYTSTCTLCGYVSTKKEAAKGHSFGAWSSNHDATCEADGTVSANCTVCGTKETRKDPGTAKGHTPQVLPEKAPTCTAPGLTQGSQCTTCQKILAPQNTVNATGHDWAEATCHTPKTCRTCAATEGDVVHKPIPLAAVAPTCTEPGLTEGIGCESCAAILQVQQIRPALGHSWCEATCEAAKTCTACAATEGEALGHTEQILEALAPTCTEPGLTEGKRCDRCSKTLLQQQTIPATGHHWLDATCTSPKTCPTCGETDGQLLPHAEVPLAAVSPTCTETGWTEGIGCEGCGTILQAQEEIPAHGHNWLEATCQKPQTCETCGEQHGAVLPHQTVTEGAFAPTCTEPGSTGTTLCCACDTVLESANIIPATGHADTDEDKTCDLCAIRLKEPVNIPVVVAIAVGAMAAMAAVTVIGVRKRKEK